MFSLLLVVACLTSIWSCRASGWFDLSGHSNASVSKELRGLAPVLEEGMEVLDSDDDEIYGVDEFFSLEDSEDQAEQSSLAVPPAANAEPITRKFSYTTGFLRAEYTDVSVKPPLFVQAVVQAIGVCYQNRQQNPRYRKVTKIVVNKIENSIILKISDYTTSNCAGNPVRSFSQQQKLSFLVRTADNVKLKVKNKYTSRLGAALRLQPVNSNGFEIR